MKPRKIYMCGVNWQHELNWPTYVKCYGTIKALKKESKCWKECGIIEIQAKLIRWVTKQKF